VGLAATIGVAVGGGGQLVLSSIESTSVFALPVYHIKSLKASIVPVRPLLSSFTALPTTMHPRELLLEAVPD
jgi:hypothetical protein